MRCWKLKALMLIVVPWFFAACEASPLPVTGAAAPPDVKIVSYSASVRVPSGHPMSVSASCQPEEQMIGGGFAASDVFEFDVLISASYPSGVSTWTVTGSGSTFQLAAEVYCVSAAVPLAIQQMQAEVAPAGSVACPKGTIILGGGFQSSQPIRASYPQGNGWYGAAFGASARVYALCAAQHVLRGSVVTSIFNAHSSTHSYYPGGGSVKCSAQQVAMSGGFDSGGDLILDNGMLAASPSGWSVTAGGDANVRIYAACGTFSG